MDNAAKLFLQWWNESYIKCAELEKELAEANEAGENLLHRLVTVEAAYDILMAERDGLAEKITQLKAQSINDSEDITSQPKNCWVY